MNTDQFAKNAADWLKDHQYACLADANGVEVWRCKKPDSIHLAFDICITRFGMTMLGDTGSLVFNVGSSYGLPFLARNPDGYMIEKLDERYRSEREFDQDAFESIVFEAIIERLREDLPDGHDQPECTTLAGLAEWIEEQGFESDLAELVDVAHEALFIDENEVRVFDWLRENEEALGLSDTWELRTDKPSASLMRRLHYISHAARQILAIKAASPAQPEVQRLREALEEIADPIKFMRGRLEDGEQLNGVYAIQMAESGNYLREIAKRALTASTEQEVEK